MNLLKWISICLFAHVSVFSFAQAKESDYQLLSPEQRKQLDYNFVAPVVTNTSAVTDAQVGLIVYDASSNEFKGLNASGSWDNMTATSGNLVTSTGSNFRVESAVVNCNSSSSIPLQTGFLSAISNNSSGRCTLTINSGTFSAQPTCVMTVDSTTNNVTTAVSVSGPTSFNIGANTGGVSAPNYDANIICMGPR